MDENLVFVRAVLRNLKLRNWTILRRLSLSHDYHYQDAFQGRRHNDATVREIAYPLSDLSRLRV